MIIFLSNMKAFVPKKNVFLPNITENSSLKLLNFWPLQLYCYLMWLYLFPTRQCSPPPVCHVSHVMRQVSHATFHMSHVRCPFFWWKKIQLIKEDKVLVLVSGGFVTKGATLSSFFPNTTVFLLINLSHPNITVFLHNIHVLTEDCIIKEVQTVLISAP